VDHAVLVRTADRVEHLRHQVERLLGGQRALGRQHVGQRAARHVLEDRVDQAAARAARVEEPHDVRVRELRAQLQLAVEAQGQLLDHDLGVVLAHAQRLDRHALPRRELARLIDATEAARAQLAHDLECAPQHGPDLDAVSRHATSVSAAVPDRARIHT
jgi:hypothetical protein